MPAVVVSTIQITFLSESLNLFLYSRTVYSQVFCYLRKCCKGFLTEKSKQTTTILASEMNALTIVPPF